MTTKLTAAASAALINVGTSRQGAVIAMTARMPEPAVLRELMDNGLVSSRYCLTRAGSIARDRAVTASVDSAFG
jgi:hypothetical protein